MRSYILSLPAKAAARRHHWLDAFAAAFIVSFLTRTFFSERQLTLDNGLTTSVYGTLGTTYAVLIAFVVSGVWQSFSDAGKSVKGEANALTDLTLVASSFSSEKTRKIHESARAYVQGVVQRWDLLALAASHHFPTEEMNLDTSSALVAAILAIRPEGAREVELYGQALDLMGIGSTPAATACAALKGIPPVLCGDC